ncbi:hypothetical protein CDAR_187211 [Caerostris darwini]|uniref:Uncharacterized protein n=1 Tax=Caerostris darwini TaxID=1538125 RepID=A0AAV4P1G9_9ARAC|nr:hypothetical protein CDAR_187211 [Caerostris darwini]
MATAVPIDRKPPSTQPNCDSATSHVTAMRGLSYKYGDDLQVQNSVSMSARDLQMEAPCKGLFKAVPGFRDKSFTVLRLGSHQGPAVS